MAQSQPQQITQFPSSVSWDAVSFLGNRDAAASLPTRARVPQSGHAERRRRGLPSRYFTSTRNTSVWCVAVGPRRLLEGEADGFRREPRPPPVHGGPRKGLNVSEGRPALLLKRRSETGSGFGGGAGAGHWRGRLRRHHCGANVGARFAMGGGFLTGGGTGSTASGRPADAPLKRAAAASGRTRRSAIKGRPSSLIANTIRSIPSYVRG